LLNVLDFEDGPPFDIQTKLSYLVLLYI